MNSLAQRRKTLLRALAVGTLVFHILYVSRVLGNVLVLRDFKDIQNRADNSWLDPVHDKIIDVFHAHPGKLQLFQPWDVLLLEGDKYWLLPTPHLLKEPCL